MASPFTPDAARALDGPPWLRDRREAAAERFASMPWPSTDEEVWRYSRIAELDLDAFVLTPAADSADLVARGRWAAAAVAPNPAAVVVVAGGTVAVAEISESWAGRGLVAGPLVDAADGERLLGSVAVEPTDLFSVFNDAFAAAPVLVHARDGLDVTDPVVVVHMGSPRGSLACPRLVVDVGQDAHVDVIDVHVGAGGGDLVVPIIELGAARAGRLGFVALQDLPLDTWHVGSQVSSVGAEATLTSATVALGGEYARHRTDCRLGGPGASGTLLAAYFGEGDQTLDFRTFQDHAAPDTTSNLLFKGAVGGRSRSVYTGLIQVRKEARGTNAFQTNRNLKLSDEAWAESVPNLEIENNDVRCSHASAVGPIDEEQRFYLESRGVPPGVAERLVVAGFFGEVLDALPVPSAAAPVAEAIAGKLERRDP